MTAFEFIKLHQMDEGEECECVILEDGSVEEPLPSHIVKLITLSGQEESWLNAHMEKGMEPLFWIVEFTKALSVWRTRVVAPSTITQSQQDALELLRDAAMLAPHYIIEQPEQQYIDSVCQIMALLEN